MFDVICGCDSILQNYGNAKFLTQIVDSNRFERNRTK